MQNVVQLFRNYTGTSDLEVTKVNNVDHLSSYVSRRQHSCKTGHFTLWKEREGL